MVATEINIQNFKNIAHESISFSKEVNIIYGANGQGKTNLLEALYLFSTGKSFRVPKDKQLILFGEESAHVRLCFDARERSFESEISLFSDKKKKQLINGLMMKQQGEMAGLFCSVLFTPEHLTLVKDGPSERRKFMDMAICQLRPKYSAAMHEYQRILSQKNSLLKDLHQNPQLVETLDIWNERLSSVAAYLTLMRGSYCKKLAVRAQNYQKEISGGKETLEVSYIGFTSELPENLKDLKELFLKKLQENLQEEIQNTTSLIGPHRDDMELMINGSQARFYASQGQQRSCVLALKLAEGDAVFDEIGEEPVYLFDDILSELDSVRQEYITKQIQGKQVFITCCEPRQFIGFQDGKTFFVENGHISEQGKA